MGLQARQASFLHCQAETAHKQALPWKTSVKECFAENKPARNALLCRKQASKESQNKLASYIARRPADSVYSGSSDEFDFGWNGRKTFFEAMF